MKKIIQLNGAWEFTLNGESPELSSFPDNAYPIGKWLKAHVPGTVHTDLIENSIIEDPFHRNNELNVQWVDQVNWIYRKEFEVTDDFLNNPTIYLIAEGLDTIATIFINNQMVAQIQNMHIEHRLDVKQLLVKGNNEIRIHFDSAIVHAKQLEDRFGVLSHTHESYRLYVRKAQYSFGWDWGPKLATCGIWKSIYLAAVENTQISDVFVESKLNDSFSTAYLDVQIQLERNIEIKDEVCVVVHLNGTKKEVKVSEDFISVPFEITDPELWWPAGYGEQKLYNLKVEVFLNGRKQDERLLKFAIRKVELIQEKDQWGHSFYFKINNTPIFCKGANWIPADSFIPRVTNEKYRELLQLAREANMNMIRIWGGGIYEQNIFYELCDELGFLVWQDFMFACGAYPEYPEFKENVSQEIESIVKRLRNHPSIVIWCGNNENEWIWQRSTGESYKKMPGYNLFHELIPEICHKLDPSRPYWPSTPFGGEHPNSPEQGNRHQWDIWSGWQDFSTVVEDNGRFISEFGFQAPASLSTWEKFTVPEDRRPQSEIMEFHNKQEEGTERLFRYLAGHVVLPTSFEDFIYKCQVVQGEALKNC
ncbi:MAG: glycoside hydrolase family 2 protein, partial [bacterium]